MQKRKTLKGRILSAFQPYELLGPKKIEMLTCYGIRFQGPGIDNTGNSFFHFFEIWISEEIEEIVAGAFIESKIGKEISELMDLTILPSMLLLLLLPMLSFRQLFASLYDEHFDSSSYCYCYNYWRH